jgi:hypothetical protein
MEKLIVIGLFIISVTTAFLVLSDNLLFVV